MRAKRDGEASVRSVERFRIHPIRHDPLLAAFDPAKHQFVSSAWQGFAQFFDLHPDLNQCFCLMTIHRPSAAIRGIRMLSGMPAWK